MGVAAEGTLLSTCGAPTGFECLGKCIDVDNCGGIRDEDDDICEKEEDPWVSLMGGEEVEDDCEDEKEDRSGTIFFFDLSNSNTLSHSFSKEFMIVS